MNFFLVILSFLVLILGTHADSGLIGTTQILPANIQCLIELKEREDCFNDLARKYLEYPSKASIEGLLNIKKRADVVLKEYGEPELEDYLSWDVRSWSKRAVERPNMREKFKNVYSMWLHERMSKEKNMGETVCLKWFQNIYILKTKKQPDRFKKIDRLKKDILNIELKNFDRHADEYDDGWFLGAVPNPNEYRNYDLYQKHYVVYRLRNLHSVNNSYEAKEISIERRKLYMAEARLNWALKQSKDKNIRMEGF